MTQPAVALIKFKYFNNKQVRLDLFFTEVFTFKIKKRGSQDCSLDLIYKWSPKTTKECLLARFNSVTLLKCKCCNQFFHQFRLLNSVEFLFLVELSFICFRVIGGIMTQTCVEIPVSSMLFTSQNKDYRLSDSLIIWSLASLCWRQVWHLKNKKGCSSNGFAKKS